MMDYKRPLNVLIIDDDGTNNFIIEKLTRKLIAHVSITVFLNGEQAIDHLLSLIRKDEVYPDFIFVDVAMPVMNGWAFLEEYKHYGLDKILKSKIIVATSSVFKQYSDKASGYAIVQDFIIKPFSLSKLDHIFYGIPRLC